MGKLLQGISGLKQPISLYLTTRKLNFTSSTPLRAFIRRRANALTRRIVMNGILWTFVCKPGPQKLRRATAVLACDNRHQKSIEGVVE